MRTFRIRKANKEDASEIAYVHVESWKSTYKGIVSDKYLQSLSIVERKEKWKQILSNSHKTYVVETKEGRIAGFVSFGVERLKQKEGELYAIYLLSEFHKKGLGRELFQLASTNLKAEGYDTMLVWVIKNNPSKYFYYTFKPIQLKEDILTIDDETHQLEGLLFQL